MNFQYEIFRRKLEYVHVKISENNTIDSTLQSSKVYSATHDISFM